MKLIGVDVGGTFTDVVYTDTDTHQVLIHKVPTTIPFSRKSPGKTAPWRGAGTARS